MTFINPIYETPKIREYLTDLINTYDYNAYTDLSYSDRCYFAGLLIEAAGKGGIECITESNDLDLTVHALQKSLTDPRIGDQQLGSTLKQFTIRYYNNLMKILFEKAYENLYQTEKHSTRRTYHEGLCNI